MATNNSINAPTNQFLQIANNLSDVNSVPTSRNNLGLGTAQSVQFGSVQVNTLAVGGPLYGGSTGSFVGPSPFVFYVSDPNPVGQVGFTFLRSGGSGWIIANNFNVAPDELSFVEQTDSTVKLQLNQGTSGSILINQSGGNTSIGSSIVTSFFNVGPNAEFQINFGGAVVAGVWAGAIIAGGYGGTGVDNSGLSIDLDNGAVGKFLSSDSLGNATWQTLGSHSVTSITGTANQVLVNGTSGTPTTGSITLTLPQSIATSSIVQFNGLGIGVAAVNNSLSMIGGAAIGFGDVAAPGGNGLIVEGSAYIGSSSDFDGHKFEVQANISDRLVAFVQTGTTSAPLVLARTAGTTAFWQMYIPTGNTSLNFIGSLNDTLSLNTNGGISIGSYAASLTSSPAESIIVSGSLYSGASSSQSTSAQIQSTKTGWNYSGSDGTVTGGIYINSASTQPIMFGSYSNHPIGFFTNNGNAQLSLLVNGSVGIGASSFSGKFWVVDSSGGFFFDGSGGTFASGNRVKSTTTSAGTGRDLVFTCSDAGNTSDLYINTSGYVGIGINPSNTSFQIDKDVLVGNATSAFASQITSDLGVSTGSGSTYHLYMHPKHGNNAATISAAYGFYIDQGTTASTITVGYSLYVRTPVFGSTAICAYFEGAIQHGSNTTGAGTALLSTNCPAVTPTAPYTWIRAISSDGSAVFIPCWK